MIAMLLLGILLGGVTALFAGTSKSQMDSKLTSRQRAAAQGILKRAVTDTSWVRQFDCGVGRCDLAADANTGYVRPDDPLLQEPDGTVRHNVQFVAVGVDEANDGRTPNDQDNIVPDVYRISVTNTTVVAEKPLKAFTATGSINMTARAGTGSLQLRTCAIRSQVDERLATGMCAKPGTETYQLAGPASCPAPAECPAWNQAFSANRARFTQVQLSPLGSVRYNLVGPLPQSPSSSQPVTTNAQGVAEVSNLRPGQYRLDVASLPLAARNYKLWRTHSVPTGGYVTIQASERSSATQIFKPSVDRPVRLHVRTDDKTDPLNVQVRYYAMSNLSVKLLPAPSGRQVLPRGERLGWTVIPYGSSGANLVGITPGLYAAQLLHYPGDRRSKLNTGSQEYVWIDPFTSGNSPSRLELRMEYCNESARMTYIPRYCDYLRWCWRSGVFVGPCDLDPTDVQDATGGGGA